MGKIAKALALVCLGVLGLAVSASARPPWTITTTRTTTTAPTTTTTASTTTDATTTETTTTAPAPSTASVTINAPLNYLATITYKSEPLSAGIVDSAPGVTCVIDWGDGTPPTIMLPVQMPNGAYQCGTSHWWTTPGTYIITVKDVNANGVAASRSDYLYVIF